MQKFIYAYNERSSFDEVKIGLWADFNSLYDDAKELIALLTSIIKTTKNNN